MAVHGHVGVQAAPYYEGGQWLACDGVHENARERGGQLKITLEKGTVWLAAACTNPPWSQNKL